MNKKLSKKDINDINKMYWEKNISPKEIAKKYSISITHIVRVSYRDKPKNINIKSFKCKTKKLNEYQVKKILVERMKNGTTQKALAQKYGVSETTISFITRGINWKHIFQKCTTKYKTEILSIAS